MHRFTGLQIELDVQIASSYTTSENLCESPIGASPFHCLPANSFTLATSWQHHVPERCAVGLQAATRPGGLSKRLVCSLGPKTMLSAAFATATCTSAPWSASAHLSATSACGMLTDSVSAPLGLGGWLTATHWQSWTASWRASGRRSPPVRHPLPCPTPSLDPESQQQWI